MASIVGQLYGAGRPDRWVETECAWRPVPSSFSCWSSTVKRGQGRLGASELG